MQSNRRSYGTGSLHVVTTSTGAQSWYGTWRPTPGGRQVKRRLGPVRAAGKRGGTVEGLTRAQAEKVLRRLMDNVTAEPVVADHMTVREAGDKYLAHLRRGGKKKSTITAVESALRVHLVPFFTGKALDKITRRDVDDLIAAMETTTRADGSRKLTPKSIHNYVGILSALCNYAMHPNRRWLTENPCAHAELPGIPKHKGIRFLEPEQVEAVASAAPAGPYKEIDAAMWRTAAMTGLRHGELVALRWCDVDWSAATVRVEQSHVLGDFGSPKSDLSFRLVPMMGDVGAHLDRWFKLSPRQDDRDLVFADPITGGPLGKRTNLLRFRKALRTAGIPDPLPGKAFRMHDLRHTFATQMASGGIELGAIQEWMGHDDPSTTKKYAAYQPRINDAARMAQAWHRGALPSNDPGNDATGTHGTLQGASAA